MNFMDFKAILLYTWQCNLHTHIYISDKCNKDRLEYIHLKMVLYEGRNL
jgi:hypothetical protein